MNQPPKTASTPSVTSQSTSYNRITSHNPYQRMASRRAIACVTCAKAKTKCDKALPSCSRCITKGIKCDPRSTRRTSENSCRTNMKKPFVSPKRYHSTSKVPTLSRHSSPRSIPSTNKHRPMRAASHIDFRTAVKMSQQASTCSGFPILTPLPSYIPQIVDGCYSYSSSPDPNLAGYTPVLEPSGLHVSGRITPQTPEPIVHHQHLSMGDISDQWMSSQLWNDDSLVSVGLGCDVELTATLPPEFWPTPEHAHSTPISQLSWHQPSLSVSPQLMSSDTVLHARAVPSLSISDCSVEDFNSLGTFHEDWAMCQHTTAQLEMASMVTSEPSMHDMRSILSTAPVWEDVFMLGRAPY